MDATIVRDRSFMKEIVFLADFFKNQVAGGGESNDHNLIQHLKKTNNLKTSLANNVSMSLLKKADVVIVGNFISLAEGVKRYLIENKKYIIYEHDHKYISTRDPSKFNNFSIPEEKIINREFYEAAECTVVLSKICKEVLGLNLPKVKTHNIGSSLWSHETLRILRESNTNKKIKDVCIVKSDNPTKNYRNTLEYCIKNSLNYESVVEPNHHKFLEKISYFKRLLFIPTVLETYSRLCAEAKMLNLDIMTNKKMIGFFSEENSKLKGIDLIDSIEERNKKALKFFEKLVC